MKRHIAMLAILIVFSVLLSGGLLSAAGSPDPTVEAPAAGAWQALDDRALEARLTHMLDRNYVFDDDFDDDAVLAQNAVLGLCEKIDDGYLKTELLEAFVQQMYGRTVDGQLANFDGAEPKPGWIAVRPQGYSVFSHRITAVLQQPDGRLTVISVVQIETHDDGQYARTAVSEFVPAPQSSFGYYLVGCHLNEANDADIAVM